MKPIVYLCGPILGRPDSECVEWRRSAATILEPEIETLDPIRRDYRGKEDKPGIERFIVQDDYEDIGISDALLVMFDKPSVGTAMEMRIAYAEVKIPTYVIDISMSQRSPWLTYHTTYFFSSLVDACKALKRDLS